MDFDLSPRVTELRDRVSEFMDEHVYPNEAEALRALDEEVTVESGRRLPADPGRDPRAGPRRGALEPVHAR